MSIHKDLKEVPYHCMAIHLLCVIMMSSLHRPQNKAWETPRVFFDGSVGSQLTQQLMEVVKRHQVCIDIAWLCRSGNEAVLVWE